MMRRKGLMLGVISVLVAQSFPVQAAPLAIAVEPIQSIGGEQNFCPSMTLQQAVVQLLSPNPAYQVQPATAESSQAAIQVRGKATCSLGIRQRQRGFALFQPPSAITTATVQLQLQLINTSTGTTIATITEQRNAQVETQPQLGDSLTTIEPADTRGLFEQAIAQTLNAMLPQINTALTQSSF